MLLIHYLIFVIILQMNILLLFLFVIMILLKIKWYTFISSFILLREFFTVMICVVVINKMLIFMFISYIFRLFHRDQRILISHSNTGLLLIFLFISHIISLQFQYPFIFSFSLVFLSFIPCFLD